jgi:hypothetical protein
VVVHGVHETGHRYRETNDGILNCNDNELVLS